MLVAGKQSPVTKSKRSTSTSSQKGTTTTSTTTTARSRVGLTSGSSSSNTRPVVTIKTPQASPGARSGSTGATGATGTTTTTTAGAGAHRRPVLNPQQTHASRILSTARAAAIQKQGGTTSTGGAAGRSGSATARSGSATARSGSATARSSSASKQQQQHSDPMQPFHRPALSALHHSNAASSAASKSRVPLTRMTDAKTSSKTGGVSSTSAAPNSRSNSMANQRSSSATSTSSNSRNVAGPGGRSGSALGGNTRTPSPVSIRPKRCKDCSALISDVEKHMSECPCAPIECRLNDSENPKTVCGFVARGHKHLSEHQQNECHFRLVDCRNAESGCTDMVSVFSMDKHVQNTCLYAVMLCEYCKQPVTRGHHEAHVATECSCVKVLCPLGCGRDILRSDLTQHISEQWKDPAHPRKINLNTNNNNNKNEEDQNQESSSNNNNNNKMLPPESARKVAETLLTCLGVVSQQKETETILAPSDEIDVSPLGGDVNSLEHALFVGQCVLRSILRLEKYYTEGKKNNSKNNNSSDYSPQFAQSVFELVERRCEAAKQRLKVHSENQVAISLKNNLETSLGRVALEVAGEEQ